VYAEELYKITQGVRLRKPTEIIIATDGFCASGCGLLSYNAKRTGSAIVTGYGGILPDEDHHFVMGQALASTIELSSFFDDVSNNSQYGLSFIVTLAELYNISEKMEEIIPSDFDTPRIDENLYYFENYDPQLEGILNKTKEIYVKYKTMCNPDNKQLVYLTEDCHVDDPYALEVGYICGDDGYWDKSSCKILTCKPMYVLDSVNNKCVPNVCDGRSALIQSSSSSSSSTKPSSSGTHSSSSKTHSSSKSSSSETGDISGANINHPIFGFIFSIISLFFCSL